MYMYNEIHQLITNDLQNYSERAITQNTITRERLEYIQTYTALWAKDEANKNLALHMAKDLDEDLYHHIKAVTSYRVDIMIDKYFIDILKLLTEINEMLVYEEQVNLGFGKNARKHRKMWRKGLREAHKWLNISHKNHINWVKENGKPRQTYVLNATGELHNGLYWTIRELIHNPKYIKYGFKRWCD